MKTFALALTACCLLFTAVTAEPKGKSAGKWVEHHDAELTDERQCDGGSFGMTIKRPKENPTIRTYRLYGVDSSESDAKDKRVEDRIKQQAEHFGCKPEEEDCHGEKVAEEKFIEKLKRLEKTAKREGLGVWKKTPVPVGRFR